MTQNETDERAIEAAEYAAELAVEADRQAALNDLLDNVTTIDLKIQSVIETLGFTNYSAEANWFNSHHTEFEEINNLLNENRVNGVLSNTVKDYARQMVALDMILNSNFNIQTTGKFPSELDNCCPW